MGFRCPNCKKEFYNDRDAFYKHIQSGGECLMLASLIIQDINHECKRIKKTQERSVKPRKKYSAIDSAHSFEKVNLVSNDDGSDNVECSFCGLKAKRYMTGRLKFDKRISYKRIEKCSGRN